MKRIFIPQSHMPPTLPIQQTFMQLFLCHYFSAPEWLWTISIVFLSAIWIACIHDIMNSTGRRIPGFGRKDSE